jgi:THO complex subunit 4
MAGVVPRPRPPPAAAARSLETGTKLHISNLDPGVTVDDVQVLFVLVLAAGFAIFLPYFACPFSNPWS